MLLKCVFLSVTGVTLRDQKRSEYIGDELHIHNIPDRIWKQVVRCVERLEENYSKESF
jgi:hypothetical protein